MFTTLGDFLYWAEKAFTEAKLHFGHGTNNAWDEAVALALFVLHLPPDSDDSVLQRKLSDEESSFLSALAKQRIEKRYPVPYLTHTAWFMGLPFYVNEHVLIPRSPIAELIEQGFDPWVESPPRRILDLCCGSGCIAIACALAFEDATVDALDIDPRALSVAKMNVIRHKVEDRLNLIQSDLFSACGKSRDSRESQAFHESREGPESREYRYDIIVSNPPYVPKEELADLPREYTYEPRLALEAGQDGLAIVRRILKEAPQYLTDQGILIVEVGIAAEQLISEYPHIPFIWLEFERGGEGVFLLKKEDESTWKLS